MKANEAVAYLQIYQDWHTGKDDRPFDETGLEPARIGEAIDSVIARHKILARENSSLRGQLTRCQIQREDFHSQLRSKKTHPANTPSE